MFSVSPRQRPALTPCQPGSVVRGRAPGATPDHGSKQSPRSVRTPSLSGGFWAKSEPMGALAGENKGQKAINHGYPTPRR